MKEMLIVHTESSLGWGGQEIRVLQECRELMINGYQVMLLADPDALIFKNAPKYGVQTKAQKLKRKRIAELLQMIEQLSILKPDVVGTHSSTDHWLVAIARPFLNKKPKIVRTRHVSAPVHRNLTTRWLYNAGCDAIITTGESIREHLTFDGFAAITKVHSIPTGIDTTYFTPRDKALARKKINVLPSTLVFCNVGTLRSWKGQDTLLRALVAFKDRDVLLFIVGNGPMMATLQNLVTELGLQNKVRLTGHHEDIRDFLDVADVFLFPSYANEGVPQAILQAMAHGLPIVTTKIGAIPEAVKGYDNVVFIEERNVQQLVEVMGSCSSRNPDAPIVCPQEVKQRIDIKAMTREVCQIYGLLFQPKKPRLSVYLIGGALTPSTRRRYLQHEPAIREKFEIYRTQNAKRISFFEIVRQPDVLFLQKLLPRVFSLLLLRLFLKGKIVFDFDDAIWESPHKKRNFFTRLKVQARFRLIKKFADKIFVSSRFLRENAQLAEQKTLVIPMAVEQPVFQRAGRAHAEENAALTFGWAGHPQSHYLIQSIESSLSTVFRHNTPFRLIILSGEKPEINVNFEWLPFSAENEKFFFTSVDIGLVPLNESLFDQGKSPIKILQHFAHSATVIYSGTGAVSEICAEENSYFLPNFRNLGALVDRIYSNRTELQKKQQCAYQFFQSQHALQVIEQRFQAALCNIHQR